MSDPVVAANEPIAVELQAGRTIQYCACGRSARQPFCDGSHGGTGIQPQPHTPATSGTVWLCRCKQTGRPPFCDGSHRLVPADKVGTPFRLVGATVADDSEADPVSGAGSLPTEGDEGESTGRNEAGMSGSTPDGHDNRAMPRAVPTAEEPYVALIHEFAEHGLTRVGSHGPVAAMGVPRAQLPSWDDIQILTAQLARPPLPEETRVGTELVIGPRARRPLHLEIPLLVSDMSFGALSEEAKLALAIGADRSGTGICSGEGGILPEERAANRRYLYELAPAQFGYREELLQQVQGFHFKCGQASKTGTGGYLPAGKCVGRVAEIRGLAAGEPAVSPAAFKDLSSPEDFRTFADRVRDITGGIPVGFKMSAQHLERDLDFALAAGADYIILDGRGGGTGASPVLFRDHIAVPTIPALARARHHLDRRGVNGRVTLIITGGLRTPADFIKALALGADGIALANAAIQAVGCVGARICHTNQCPAGVATQDPDLRARLKVDHAARRMERFFEVSVELMQVMARACGHRHLHDFNRGDLCSWKRDVAELAGIAWSGPTSDREPSLDDG